ncbi:MAG TPA: hypothetical protein VER83_04315 [Candidatus Nanopelagicales bacterium]|nr:hypothetical protein [Candidatus Nanopelagicales bacterium]
MLNKIALLVASLTAALVIAGGLALAGFGAPSPAADMQAVDAVVVPADAAVPADAGAPVQVDTIYLAPQPTPEEITVTQVKEASHHDDDEDEGHESEGEDD